MTTPEVIPPIEGQRKTITVQGIETHFFEAGNPTAPPLLYLHGTHLGNLWIDYHQSLSRTFHLIAPDIPGFGLTERPDWMRDMSDYILYFRDLIAALNLHHPFIVGHSLGGWIAAEIAIFYPHLLSKLVLSNAAGIRVKGSPIADLFAMNPMEILAVCFDDWNAAAPLMPAEINETYLLAQYKERMTLATLAWNPHFDPKMERRLAWITCPTLVIWGENDRLIPPIYGDTFHRLIPGSKLVKLTGTGHMPMFEQAEPWTHALTEFLLADKEATHE